MKEIDFIRHAARRITLGGMCAVLVLGSTACHREMEAVDREAVNMLEMEQTVDASSVADEIHELESSREQSVADSIAESSREESQSIADSIAALEAEEASKAAEESARAASEAAATNQAAQAEYLQQLVAGTNLVPNGVTTITTNDLPVIQKLFRNTVVIGDSRAEGLSAYGILSDSEVSYVRGAHVDQMYGAVATAASRNPSKAIFMMGLNDMLVYNGDSAAWIASYHALIENFRSQAPNCQIYVHCVLPVTQASIDRQPLTGYCSAFSQAEYQMCLDYGYHYVDGTAYLSPDLYYSDGQHFQKAFYMYWVQDMANQLGLWGEVTP